MRQHLTFSAVQQLKESYSNVTPGSDDIDLFRGAANTARKGEHSEPGEEGDEGWDMATTGRIVTPLFKQ